MNPWFEQQSQHVLHLARTTESRVHRLPVLGVLAQAWRAYNRDQCSMLAASLAYYALLSIFPLLLFVLAILSEFLESDAAVRAVTQLVNAYLPAGSQMIRASLQEVIRLRGALTIAAAGGFIWSASSVFDLIQLGICRAFGVARGPSLLRRRLLSLAMVIGASILFGLSFANTTLMRMAIHYHIFERGTVELQILSILSALILGFLVFGMLYRYLPIGVKLHWKRVVFGALVAAILWEIAKLGFAWYVTSFAFLNMVYGSLGAIIALMLWGYVTAVILLFGAEIVAVQASDRLKDQGIVVSVADFPK